MEIRPFQIYDASFYGLVQPIGYFDGDRYILCTLLSHQQGIGHDGNGFFREYNCIHQSEFTHRNLKQVVSMINKTISKRLYFLNKGDFRRVLSYGELPSQLPVGTVVWNSFVGDDYFGIVDSSNRTTFYKGGGDTTKVIESSNPSMMIPYGYLHTFKQEVHPLILEAMRRYRSGDIVKSPLTGDEYKVDLSTLSLVPSGKSVKCCGKMLCHKGDWAKVVGSSISIGNLPDADKVITIYRPKTPPAKDSWVKKTNLIATPLLSRKHKK